MQRHEYAEMIGVLLAAYGKQIDENTVNVYFEYLKDIPTGTLKNAVNTAIRTEEFFPSVATLRRIAVENQNNVPTEAEVMADLRQAIKEYGIYESPKFLNDVTHAIAEEVGWNAICNMDEIRMQETIHFRYKPVANQYKHAKIDGSEFPTTRLQGLHEMNNKRIGHTGAVPIKASINKIDTRGDNE